jgi:hypothetical protein
LRAEEEEDVSKEGEINSKSNQCIDLRINWIVTCSKRMM